MIGVGVPVRAVGTALSGWKVCQACLGDEGRLGGNQGDRRTKYCVPPVDEALGTQQDPELFRWLPQQAEAAIVEIALALGITRPRDALLPIPLASMLEGQASAQGVGDWAADVTAKIELVEPTIGCA